MLFSCAHYFLFILLSSLFIKQILALVTIMCKSLYLTLKIKENMNIVAQVELLLQTGEADNE